MSTLLSPDGCPWDREQDIESLRPYLIEECFELVDAIDNKDVDNHCEELGDLLFQIVFQSAVRDQEKKFDIDQVIDGICDKLIRRHPHVFSDTHAYPGKKAEDAQAISMRWEEIKAEEKKAKGSQSNHLLDGVPMALPALSRAQKISQKVGSVGFDWPTALSCLQKVREECTEVEEALAGTDRAHLEEEIGDLLFASVSLARKAGVDASLALSRANEKFESRFRLVEDRLKALGKTPKSSNLQEMDGIWNEIKHL